MVAVSVLKLNLRTVRAMLRAGRAATLLRRWADREEEKRRRRLKPSEVGSQIGLGKLGFKCERLGCSMAVAACIKRQLETDRERSRRHDAGPSSSPMKRGTAFTFPSCDTLKCPLGAALRNQFGDECAARVRSGERTIVVGDGDWRA